MGVTVVVGAQWGDEGKGKIVDLLARDFDYVVRFHGGPNAGHTIKVGDRTLKLHHIPSGVLHPNCQLVIANGVVVDPEILLEELRNLREKGIDLTGRLTVSKDCHLILPYHKMLEDHFAQAKEGNMDTRSTGRGIGPVHADKTQYLGIKVADLYNLDILQEKLRVNLRIKSALIESLPSEDWFMKYLEGFSEELSLYVRETAGMLNRVIEKGANVLCEGAQGVFLDVDHGFYPFVTASNMVPGAVNAGAGIPPSKIFKVIGVAKAYVTRVGDGPFLTEIEGNLAQFIQEKGAERGTTTGRLRRVGWFDTEMVKTAHALCGFDELVLTKIDILGEIPQLCIGNSPQLAHRKVSYLEERDPAVLQNRWMIKTYCTPWKEDLSAIQSFGDFPPEAVHYVRLIEKMVGVPIRIVSVGPDREQTVYR